LTEKTFHDLLDLITKIVKRKQISSLRQKRYAMAPTFHTLKTDFQIGRNRLVGSYPETLRPILSLKAAKAAHAEISNWPGYGRTPLVALPKLAERLAIAKLNYKDEGSRFGLGSFKALGGAYAVFRLVADAVAEKAGTRPTSSELTSGKYADITRGLTVTCATDGNHGRSVAWGASIFGCQCVIYVHATVSAERAAAIARFGAQVVRTEGNYDDAVRQADSDAARLGRLVVSDTSYEGYLDVPRYVMQGYSVMVQEALDQLSERREELPTHVFIQGGVGGLAAAVTAHLWETFGDKAPAVVVVEPDKAACLFESARAGKPTAVKGDLDTIMAGLACGEVSELAWQVLDPGAAAFMTIEDEAALEAMRLLASGDAGARIVGGESAVAGLAGLICLSSRTDWREAIGLGSQARVLLFGSEGDTDPQLYNGIVGMSGDEVRALAS